MKAFHVLMALHSIELRKGYQYLDAPKKESLALGGGDTQYLYEVEKS